MNKFAGANLFQKFSVKTSNRSKNGLACNVRAQLRSFMVNDCFTGANLLSTTNSLVCEKICRIYFVA